MKKILIWPILVAVALTLGGKASSAPHSREDGICTEEGKLSIGKLASPEESPLDLNEKNYTLEITRNHLKFDTSGCESLAMTLAGKESEEIQKLSMDFVNLLQSSNLTDRKEAEVLDSKDLNPVMVLTNSELSIRFVKMAKSMESNFEGGSGERSILWKFFERFAKEVFDRKLKELNVKFDESEEDESKENESKKPGENSPEGDFGNFQNFISTLSKIMKISIKYAEFNFRASSTPETKTEMLPVKHDQTTSKQFNSQ